MGLNRVKSALALEDDSRLDLIARDVIANDVTQVVLSNFLRKNALFEVPDRRRLVQLLLAECFKLHAENLRKQKTREEVKAKDQLVSAGS